jgi:uncharacterized repeat protein (TIGR03806 family)
MPRAPRLKAESSVSLAVAGWVLLHGLSCASNTTERYPDVGPEPFGLRERIVNTRCRLGGRAASLAPYDAERVFPLLPLEKPTQILHHPADPSRVLVLEQTGRIVQFEARADVSVAEPFLDLSARTECCGEQGLLGFAFHPRYAENRALFVYHTASNPRRGVLLRYQTQEGNPLAIDPSSETPLLEVPHPTHNHHGGAMYFDAEGRLLLSIGDGSGALDADNLAQRLDDLHGKLLRIDVDQEEGGRRYAIPPDNPFVGRVGARAEIYALGFRNPWRCDLDRVTGRLLCADVGEARLEEIDFVEPGRNYGWHFREGSTCVEEWGNCAEAFVPPIFEYSHEGGACAVVGGFTYRASAFPELDGGFLYGDFCTGRVSALFWDGERVVENRLVAATGLSLSGFGRDPAGEPYLLHHLGGIFRLRRAVAPDTSDELARTLSATGCFERSSSRRPAPGVIPFDVSSPLWSDGLHKRRFLVLPGVSTFGFREHGAWDVPDDTLLIKEFLLDFEEGNPASRRPIETRFLRKERGAWQGYSYRWNEEGTEAHLLDDTVTAEYVVTRAGTGEPSTFRHTFPSRTDCLRCHTDAARGTLGLSTPQMNRSQEYDGVLANQLRAMEHIGLFGDFLPKRPEALPRLPNPADARAPIEVRARAYLHANCAHCHLPGGPTAAEIDLREEVPLSDTRVCDVAPLRGDLGLSGAAIVRPGRPDESILLRRMAARGPEQMPPLATHLVDAAAVQLVREWILSLTKCPPAAPMQAR